MHVLMLVMSDVDHDSRVRREAQTLVSGGHTVSVFALGGKSAEYIVCPMGATSPFPSGGTSQRGRSQALRRLARWSLLPAHEAALRKTYGQRVRASVDTSMDVVHAHDFETLPIGAELAERFGARLVYDAHECWVGRFRRGRPTPVRRLMDARLEADLGRRAQVVLTVSEALATWFRHRYGWEHVAVVRNTFPELHGEASAEHRVASPPRGLLYAGHIAAGRDLSTLVGAVEQLPFSQVTLIGPIHAPFVNALELPRNVIVRPPVAVDEVDRLYREAGIAVVPLEDNCLNHRVALPNKLFHAVRAGVPVVASDLPQIAEMVKGHDLGELYRPGNSSSLVAAVERVVARHAELVANVRAARGRHLWQHDADVLNEVYRRMAAG